MVKSILRAISSIRLIHSQNTSSHTYLQELLEHSLPEPVASQPSKVQIDLSLLEEFATILSNLCKNDIKQKKTLEKINDSSEDIFRLWESVKMLKHDMYLFQTSFEEDFLGINKLLKQVIGVHKEFKSRCQSGFLDYLKGVDVDLRKILKPLVPSSVIKEQVKFPLINTNSSLRSSVQSIAESAADDHEEPSMKSQPEPSEVTIQKLNAHIQMLVGTLENIAKDLIQVLAEADREYYQVLNKQEIYSRPPTPLAAPLPDYFCYELQDTPRENPYKQIMTAETKEIWIRRLKRLYGKNELKEELYKSLMGKLERSSETRKLDLKELFTNTDVSIADREGLVYYLINGSTEFEKHVSISQMMSESKLKPEPPKNPKPKSTKAFHKLEKETERRSSPVNPDLEVARISQGSMLQNGKVVNSIRLISKSPKIERLFKNRKSVRVRSITPVSKEKANNLKARTPSVQNNKVSLSAFYAKQRLRKNI